MCESRDFYSLFSVISEHVMDAFTLGHKSIRFYFFVCFISVCVWKWISKPTNQALLFSWSPALWAQSHRIWFNSSLSILRTYKWPSSWCQRPHLQCLESVWKRFHPDKEGGYDDGWWVVGAVVASCWHISYRVKVCWIKRIVKSKGKEEWHELATYLPPLYSLPPHISVCTSVSFSLSEHPLAWTSHGKLQDSSDSESIKDRDKSKRITFITLAPYNIYFQDKDVTVCGLTSDW